jgi:hypothetical protein
MDWGSYLAGAGTVLVTVFVGYVLGMGVNRKTDDANDTRPSHPDDIK